MKILKRYLTAKRILKAAHMDNGRAFGAAVCLDFEEHKMRSKRARKRFAKYRQIKHWWQPAS